MSYANDIAVRYNFQKIAPLGIGEDDYKRIGDALQLSEDYVRELCEGYKRQVAQSAQALKGQLPRALHKQRVCFIGDSLTSERTSYMRIIREVFADDANVEVIDCSISGWNTSDVLFEYENAVTPHKPTIIHMFIGANDARNAYPGEDGSTASLDAYRRNILRLIRYGLDLGASVIVSTVSPTLPAKEALPNGNIPRWETQAFNEILRDIARTEPIVLNDMEAELQSRLDEIIDTFDNVHLNHNGQRIIAERVLSRISGIIANRNH